MNRFILLITGILYCLTCFSQVDANGSYLNVTRPSGGPISAGDIIELHSVISVSSGASISNLSYTDNIPSGVSYVSGSLKVVTNENKVVSSISNTGAYTDAADGDRGKVVASAITVFMGNSATSSAGGTVAANTTKPTFQNGTAILMVAYRVQVTASFGSTITTAGVFHYPARTSTTLVIRSVSPGSARILFLNTSGTLLYSRSVIISTGTNTVDLSLPAHLPAGIYIVRTITGSESAVSRLIVE